MKNLLTFRWTGLFTISLLMIIMSACGKNENLKSEAKAAEFSENQASASGNTSSQSTPDPNTADEAMAQAQCDGDFLFMLFFEKKDDTFQQMRATVQEFTNNTSQKIDIYETETTNSKESNIIQKYGIDRAPLPLLLVFAPNGAITGGFPLQQISREQLEQAIVSELVMNLLKSVQSNRVALVLLKNDKTAFNDQATQAAEDFAADNWLNGFVDIIQQNPLDATITDFLTQCKLDKNLKEATVALIVPPGQIGGVYSGNITKETLIAGLASCAGGCGSGCN